MTNNAGPSIYGGLLYYYDHIVDYRPGQDVTSKLLRGAVGMQRVPVLFNHSEDHPVGLEALVYETENSPAVLCEIAPQTYQQEPFLRNCKLSIAGFAEEHQVDADGIRLVSRFRVTEVSLTRTPRDDRTFLLPLDFNPDKGTVEQVRALAIILEHFKAKRITQKKKEGNELVTKKIMSLEDALEKQTAHHIDVFRELGSSDIVLSIMSKGSVPLATYGMSPTKSLDFAQRLLDLLSTEDKR
jgi:hypothetical protein